MSKTYKHSDKKDRPEIRNNVAYGMIVSGTGIKKIFKDRRMKRSKERQNFFRDEEWD